MKRKLKSATCVIIVIIVLFVITLSVFAHSGRTDSRGGHRDNKNSSGLGGYHYHHGYGPHLHPNGKCPYIIVEKTTPTKISVDNVSIISSDITFQPGGSRVLTVKINPNNATDKSVTWTSSDSNVVSVVSGTINEKSIINANRSGDAVITVKSSNGLTDSINVTVLPVVACIEINEKDVALEVGEYKTLGTTIYPIGVVDNDIVWSSEDSNIVTVDATGKVTAIKSGTTNVMVTTSNEKTDSVTVTVNKKEDPVTEIPVMKTNLLKDDGDFEENDGIGGRVIFGIITLLLLRYLIKRKKK